MRLLYNQPLHKVFISGGPSTHRFQLSLPSLLPPILDRCRHMLLGLAVVFSPTFLPGIAHHTRTLVPSKSSHTHNISLITHLSRRIRDLPFRTSPVGQVHRPLALSSLPLVPERMGAQTGRTGRWNGRRRARFHWMGDRCRATGGSSAVVLIQHSYRRESYWKRELEWSCPWAKPRDRDPLGSVRCEHSL